MPASHSRRCTSIVALGISALPPTWLKMKMRVDDEVYLAGIAGDRL
jgi:hypothetical protein